MKTGYFTDHRTLATMTLVLLATLALAGCAQQQDVPPQIVVDKTACARCSMLISDGRFAAALKENGKYLVFDDIGCMLSYSNEHTLAADDAVWVRDYTTDSWIGAKSVTFYHGDGDLTPMGYGYVAVAQPATVVPPALKNPIMIGSLSQLRADLAARIN